MKSFLLGVVSCLLICGCSKAPEEAQKPEPPKPPGAATAGPEAGITPVGPNVGSITPVTGEVGGTTGGGIGQAAKNQARNAASNAANNGSYSPSSEGEDTTGQ